MANKTRLSDEIYRRAEKKGLSLAEIARQCNVHYQTLHGWIARNTFPEEAVKRIAGVLNLTRSIDKLQNTYTFSQPRRTSQWDRGTQTKGRGKTDEGTITTDELRTLTKTLERAGIREVSWDQLHKVVATQRTVPITLTGENIREILSRN